jgi:hypothetical protein
VIRTELMPDELALSALVRLKVLNDWPGRRMSNATGQLRNALDAEGWVTDGLTNAGLLALAAGMPAEQFVRLHTLLPFRFVAADFCAHVPHGAPGRARTEQVYGLALPTGRLFACRGCATDDVRCRGFSWYRRSHQIPGLEWCDTHRMPLSWIDDEEPGCELPHVWFERGLVRDVSSGVYGQYSRSPGLQRYLSACNALLDRVAPADCRILNRKLTTRARALGMGVDSQMHEGRLRAAISNVVDQRWLLEHLPDIHENPRLAETRLGRLLLDPRSVAQGADYGLIIAVLYDDVDSAVNLLFGIRKPIVGSVDPATSDESRQPAHGDLVMSI